MSLNSFVTIVNLNYIFVLIVTSLLMSLKKKLVYQ